MRAAGVQVGVREGVSTPYGVEGMRAASVQRGVAVRGETFQATSLHTPYDVETPQADVSTWGRCARVGCARAGVGGK